MNIKIVLNTFVYCDNNLTALDGCLLKYAPVVALLYILICVNEQLMLFRVPG
jgi:hypothetical protein